MTTKRTTKKAGTAATRKSASRKPAKKASPAKAAPTCTPKSTSRDSRLPAVGSTLTRSYHGKEHVVEVIEGGLKYQGETYTSLTALAKKITGYRAISGPAFFGLWKRAEAK